MRWFEGRGIRTARWDGANQYLMADELIDLVEAQYHNFVVMSASRLLRVSAANDRNYVTRGLLTTFVSGRTCTLAVGAAISLAGYYRDNGGTFSFVDLAGDVFAVIVPADETLVFDANSDASPRIDIVEIRPARYSYDDDTRSFRDPISGIVTGVVMDTVTGYSCEVRIVKGTAGSAAPASTPGWIKVAEVTISTGGVGSTVSAVATYLASASWTTDVSLTYGPLASSPYFDWGSAGEQIDATDFPIADAGSLAIEDDVGATVDNLNHQAGMHRSLQSLEVAGEPTLMQLADEQRNTPTFAGSVLRSRAFPMRKFPTPTTAMAFTVDAGDLIRGEVWVTEDHRLMARVSGTMNYNNLAGACSKVQQLQTDVVAVAAAGCQGTNGTWLIVYVKTDGVMYVAVYTHTTVTSQTVVVDDLVLVRSGVVATVGANTPTQLYVSCASLTTDWFVLSLAGGVLTGYYVYSGSPAIEVRSVTIVATDVVSFDAARRSSVRYYAITWVLSSGESYVRLGQLDITAPTYSGIIWTTSAVLITANSVDALRVSMCSDDAGVGILWFVYNDTTAGAVKVRRASYATATFDTFAWQASEYTHYAGQGRDLSICPMSTHTPMLVGYVVKSTNIYYAGTVGYAAGTISLDKATIQVSRSTVSRVLLLVPDTTTSSAPYAMYSFCVDAASGRAEPRNPYVYGTALHLLLPHHLQSTTQVLVGDGASPRLLGAWSTTTIDRGNLRCSAWLRGEFILSYDSTGAVLRVHHVFDLADGYGSVATGAGVSSLSDSNLFQSGTAYVHATVIDEDSGTFLIVGYDGSAAWNARVAQVASDGTLSWVTSAQALSLGSTTVLHTVVRVPQTNANLHEFVVSYHQSPTYDLYVKGIQYNVSGGTLSVGSATAVTTGVSGTAALGIVALRSLPQRFACLYTNGTNLRGKLGAVSGTTLTVGAEATVATDTAPASGYMAATYGSLASVDGDVIVASVLRYGGSTDGWHAVYLITPYNGTLRLLSSHSGLDYTRCSWTRENLLANGFAIETLSAADGLLVGTYGTYDQLSTAVVLLAVRDGALVHIEPFAVRSPVVTVSPFRLRGVSRGRVHVVGLTATSIYSTSLMTAPLHGPMAFSGEADQYGDKRSLRFRGRIVSSGLVPGRLYYFDIATSRLAPFGDVPVGYAISDTVIMATGGRL